MAKRPSADYNVELGPLINWKRPETEDDFFAGLVREFYIKQHLRPCRDRDHNDDAYEVIARSAEGEPWISGCQNNINEKKIFSLS